MNDLSLDTSMQAAFADQLKEFARVGGLFESKIGINPRKWSRILKAWALQMHMAEMKELPELVPSCLLMLLVREYYPDLFKSIRRNGMVIVYILSYSRGGRITIRGGSHGAGSRKDAREAVVNSIGDENLLTEPELPKVCEALVDQFDKEKLAFDKTYGGDIGEAMSNLAKRIATLENVG